MSNPTLDPCEVCKEQQAETLPRDFDGVHQHCPRCGEFKVTGTASSLMNRGLGNDKRAKLSGWVREQYVAGSVPTITSNNLTTILARPLPSVAERATRLLQEAGRGQKQLGERFNTGDPRFLAATYSWNKDDIHFLMGLLKEQGFAEYKAIGGSAEILPRGYIALDELLKPTSNSKQGFIAMWFAKDLDDAYAAGFYKGITNAGYDPLRVDQVEHTNRIDDEIIAQIKASRFVVADFTGHRGGVYFEAGFALGLAMPVIWTCRKDHMKELHFDIRQFNCIDWESPDELCARLSKRIEATLGVGPGKILNS